MAITFTETKLAGAFIIKPEIFADERGFFARSFSQQEFEEHGINTRTAECHISFNKQRYTLRGLHFQADPFAQAKLVRCTQGAIYDVIVDLRRDSPTFKQWFGQELTAQNRLMLYVPAGFAHGYQTLEDDSEMYYQVSEFYEPASCRGVRWDDSAFGIRWPAMDGVILNERDRSYPDFVG